MKASLLLVCGLAQIRAENIVSSFTDQTSLIGPVLRASFSQSSHVKLSIRPSAAPAETTHNPFILLYKPLH